MFRTVEERDGYLAIEDHGLIGDGATAGLVGRSGAIDWLRVPRFDSEPLFCAILDRERGGTFAIRPEGLAEARQAYDGETGILVTELRQVDGSRLIVTDALLFHAGANLTEDRPAARGELLRSVRAVGGTARLRIEVEPRGGASAAPTHAGMRIRVTRQPKLELWLSANRPLAGLRTDVELAEGERLDLTLSWGGRPDPHRSPSVERRLEATRRAWQSWTREIAYHGPQAALVRRSAITLKMLDHFQNGAIVAAPTSSLPEAVGGSRNWDYRYTWVRDAAFSVHALRRIGMTTEAWGFLAWTLDAVERDNEVRVMYDLAGGAPPREQIDADLQGYRGSRPVRFGNAAADQRQNDVYGELVDCAYLWSRGGEVVSPELWARLVRLIESARRVWRSPDHGIWEVRTAGRTFTYSAALCQVALDRGALLAERCRLPGDIAGWRREADRIREAILADAWNEGQSALTEHLGGDGGLDASLLTLPLRRVLPADHPRMLATTAAISARLGAGNGLVYRYLPEVSPDGLPGHEGAFLLCSFWLVENLSLQGRLDEAEALFESLCARVNPLGLLPEQIDPASGAFLGNFPQAFSHVGLIASGVRLARTRGYQRP